MKSLRLVLVVVVAFLLTSIAAVLAAECTRVVVTNEDIERAQYTQGSPAPTPATGKSWYQLERKSVGGAYGTGIVDTAFGAPAGGGVGSFHSQTTDGGSKVTLFNLDYVGKTLSGLEQISYYTYRNTGSGDQLPALNIQLDSDGNGTIDAVLVYEPVYNNATQPVVSGAWQNWDAYNGTWWTTSPINGMCAGATYTCMQSLSTIIANNPDAVIYGIGINQGSGNPGLDAASDLLSITYDGVCETYDFEPYKVASTADECKNNGYKNVKTASGAPFKNQGQCIQYVNTGK
jgi:hypothetical protein